MLNGQNYVYSLFVALLVGSLACSQSTPVAAADQEGIAPSASEIDPVRAGEMAPKFTVRTVAGEPFVFDPETLDAPAVLITFRGGWCPYCNMHLSELRHVVPQLEARGVDVYFLSGDRPELLYASLERETREEIDGLGYTILSDADIDAARALGIAFRVDDSTIERRERNGQDIEGSSMRNYRVLPVPAVYVIDTGGKVAYSFVEPDYKVRLPAEELLDAVGMLFD